MGLLDRLWNWRNGDATTPQPTGPTNEQVILDALVGSEFNVGDPRTRNFPSFTIEISMLRGRPHINVRTRIAAGIEKLRGTILEVVDRRNLQLVGTMTLGLTGSVLHADMELLKDVEISTGDPMRIRLPEPVASEEAKPATA
jgi:hypothetical protein